MSDESIYLVRYGAMGTVKPGYAQDFPLQRGQFVVLRTPRGLELGEVLGQVRTHQISAEPVAIARVADSNDMECVTDAARTRSRLLELVESIFSQGQWPIEVVDVEQLLDPERVVVYYLGPYPLETDGLCALVKEQFGPELIFELAGTPSNSAETSCSSGGCGSDTKDKQTGETSGKGCGTGAGCGSCAVASKVRTAKSGAH